MARGGKRPGAGRKLGSNKYGCPTKVMRVPVDYIGDVAQLLQSKVTENQNIKNSQEAIPVNPCPLTLYVMHPEIWSSD